MDMTTTTIIVIIEVGASLIMLALIVAVVFRRGFNTGWNDCNRQIQPSQLKAPQQQPPAVAPPTRGTNVYKGQANG